jgi:competence ComEA-like helix-hairpin-helix protein
VHTRTAELQSLHEHLLAYVKQYLPPAKLAALAIVAVILSAAACVKLPRSLPSEAQLKPDTPQVGRVAAININTASQPELERLPGVGQGIAERIVAHREQFGRFRRAEHLMMVRGISERKFRELRAMIAVE